MYCFLRCNVPLSSSQNAFILVIVDHFRNGQNAILCRTYVCEQLLKAYLSPTMVCPSEFTPARERNLNHYCFASFVCISTLPSHELRHIIHKENAQSVQCRMQ
eukprot:scpid70610/ scgid24277/ 